MSSTPPDSSPSPDNRGDVKPFSLSVVDVTSLLELDDPEPTPPFVTRMRQKEKEAAEALVPPPLSQTNSRDTLIETPTPDVVPDMPAMKHAFPMDRFSKRTPLHDTEFIAAGKNGKEVSLFVSIRLLAELAPFFRQFVGSWNIPGKYYLADMHSENFRMFLNVLIPSPYRHPLDISNVCMLAKYSFVFQAWQVFADCDRFIRDHIDDIEISELLLLVPFIDRESNDPSSLHSFITDRFAENDHMPKQQKVDDLLDLVSSAPGRKQDVLTAPALQDKKPSVITPMIPISVIDPLTKSRDLVQLHPDDIDRILGDDLSGDLSVEDSVHKDSIADVRAHGTDVIPPSPDAEQAGATIKGKGNKGRRRREKSGSMVKPKVSTSNNEPGEPAQNFPEGDPDRASTSGVSNSNDSSKPVGGDGGQEDVSEPIENKKRRLSKEIIPEDYIDDIFVSSGGNRPSLRFRLDLVGKSVVNVNGLFSVYAVTDKGKTIMLSKKGYKLMEYTVSHFKDALFELVKTSSYRETTPPRWKLGKE